MLFCCGLVRRIRRLTDFTIGANKIKKLSSHSKFIWSTQPILQNIFILYGFSFDTYRCCQYTDTDEESEREKKIAHAWFIKVTNYEQTTPSWQTKLCLCVCETEREKKTPNTNGVEHKCMTLLCIVGRNTNLLYFYIHRIVIEFSKHKIRWSKWCNWILFVNLICHFWPFTN